jgi:predicted CoA-binding protein
MKNVAIIASNFRPDRYSFKAFTLLKSHGYPVFPVAPAIKELEGIPVSRSIMDITADIHTVTLYMNPHWLKEVIPSIIEKNPACVIFNPGTEAGELEQMLTSANIRLIHACTLVLLNTGQFENL